MGGAQNTSSDVGLDIQNWVRVAELHVQQWASITASRCGWGFDCDWCRWAGAVIVIGNSIVTGICVAIVIGICLGL